MRKQEGFASLGEQTRNKKNFGIEEQLLGISIGGGGGGTAVLPRGLFGAEI